MIDQPLIQVSTSASDNLWLVGSTLLGAVVGALASGVITWWLAKQTARREGKSRQRSMALRLVVKSKLLADSAYSTHRMIELQIAEADRVQPHAPTWAKLVEIVPLDTPPIFLEADEVSLLIEMKDDDLTNDFMLLTHRERAIEVSLREYVIRRRELTDLINAESGRAGNAAYQQAQAAHINPRLIEVGMLADNLRTNAAEQCEQTMDLVRRLGPTLKSFLQDPEFPIGVVPPNIDVLADRPAKKKVE